MRNSPRAPGYFLMTAESRSAPFEKRGLQPVSALACQICFFTICRRSAAMNVDRAGVSRRVIVQITGHKTEAMFLRYRIVNSRDLSDAAHRMEDCLKQPATGKVTGKVGSSTVWGGLWDSNPRLSEPQSDALPPELKPP
jgi:hypothetical protein